MAHQDFENRKTNPPKFSKGQKVYAIKAGEKYVGTINSVIDMETYYDYYVSTECPHQECQSPITVRVVEHYIDARTDSCCDCDCSHSKEKKEKKETSPKFHREQRVKATKDGVEYLGHISCVIDMKTSIDYSVSIYCACCGALTTLRCPEEDITACDPRRPDHCIYCRRDNSRYKKEEKIPPPRFQVGDRVRITSKGTANHNHYGTVIEVTEGISGVPWFYKIKIKGSLVKGWVRYYEEDLFEAVECCCCCCKS